jgi:alkylation response protein AidB-like acyl-CoA dehydrogenase
MATAWQRLSPHPVWRSDPLASIERALGEPDAAALLSELESERAYPAPLLARIDALSVARIFADPALATPYHVGALAEILARSSGALAISVAVNSLALLPAYVAARPEQLDVLRARVLAGDRAALLLTELGHGSDLLATETFAELGHQVDGRFSPCEADDATHARIRGDKQLINGGSKHRLLVVLARTRLASPADGRLGAGDLSLFCVERDHSVEALPKWQTSAAPGADIAGVRFHDTVVPLDSLVGELGDGIAVLNKTLAMSRGGISALAAGAAQAAHTHAHAYARARVLYGAPIASLGAIADHLARANACSLACAALSVKQAALVNGLGAGAAYHAAAAKLACCSLAEDAVTEGRQVLGARALLCSDRYERLVRDVLLYGVFDGTRHLMLEQLHWRLAQMAARSPASDDGHEALARTAALYHQPPQSFTKVARLSARPWLPHAPSYARALAKSSRLEWLEALATIAEALLDCQRALSASGRWPKDQAIRHLAGEQLASVEVLLALAELAEEDGRAALDLRPIEGEARERYHLGAEMSHARGLLGARLAAGMRSLGHLAPEVLPALRDLDVSERALTRGYDHARAFMLAHEPPALDRSQSLEQY